MKEQPANHTSNNFKTLTDHKVLSSDNYANKKLNSKEEHLSKSTHQQLLLKQTSDINQNEDSRSLPIFQQLLYWRILLTNIITLNGFKTKILSFKQCLSNILFREKRRSGLWYTEKTKIKFGKELIIFEKLIPNAEYICLKAENIEKLQKLNKSRLVNFLKTLIFLEKQY